jgi:GNAT superfamily N-acetyltransferase
MFPQFDGMVEDRGEYIVVRTPDNPGFWWGNFLLFRTAPTEGSLENWKSTFEKEFGPGRMTIGWDVCERGAVEPFLADGWSLNESATLVTDRTNPPPKPNDQVEIRPLKEDEDWNAAIDLQVLCREPWFEESSYRTYRLAQMAQYRKMQKAGRGAWLGAFSEGKLVADLGVFVDGDLGRFQAVETHPDFRCRGICGTLVHAAAEYALELGAKQLVMIAEEEGPQRVYESVGLRYLETEYGLERP